MNLRDDDLDEEFPLGDGTAEIGAVVCCPYCGEINEIALDPGSGSIQEYVEDCQVCCRPWRVTVRYGTTAVPRSRVSMEDSARSAEPGVALVFPVAARALAGKGHAGQVLRQLVAQLDRGVEPEGGPVVHHQRPVVVGIGQDGLRMHARS